MQRIIVPAFFAAALACAVPACTHPEDAYTPVDELKAQREAAEAAKTTIPETEVVPPPVDPALPDNPALPPDPNAPPMDPTQEPPPSPEDPPNQTMVPEDLPTS